MHSFQWVFLPTEIEIETIIKVHLHKNSAPLRPSLKPIKILWGEMDFKYVSANVWGLDHTNENGLTMSEQ